MIVLGFLPGDAAAGERRTRGIAHGLLQALLEFGFARFFLGHRLAYRLQFQEGCCQAGIAAEVSVWPLSSG